VNLRRLVEEGMRDPHRLPQLTNDFETPVFKHHPVIEHVKEMMLDNGAVFSMMSGSGSTVYGMFDDEEKAREAAVALAAPGFATFLTEPHFAPSDE
jgi:4-diphosphocytidyl-2-C-methyl-D-erythritol kinase